MPKNNDLLVGGIGAGALAAGGIMGYVFGKGHCFTAALTSPASVAAAGGIVSFTASGATPGYDAGVLLLWASSTSSNVEEIVAVTTPIFVFDSNGNTSGSFSLSTSSFGGQAGPPSGTAVGMLIVPVANFATSGFPTGPSYLLTFTTT